MTSPAKPEPERVTFTLDEVEQAYQLVRGVERALKAHSLTIFQFFLLRAIATDPSVPLNVTGTKFGVSPTAITLNLDRLEHQGYAQRQGRGDASSPDRRHIHVQISERGQALLDAFAEIEVKL